MSSSSIGPLGVSRSPILRVCVICISKNAARENVPRVRNLRGCTRGAPPKAPEARYPYSASLQYDSQHFCGGALVAPDIVITAAHCDSTATITGIVLGRYDLDSATDYDYEVMEVVDAVLHPGWDPIKVSNDVALLLLGGESRHPYVRINGDGDVPTEGEYLAVLGELEMVLHRGSLFRFHCDLFIFNLLVFMFPSPAQTSNAIPPRSLFLLPVVCVCYFLSFVSFRSVPFPRRPQAGATSTPTTSSSRRATSSARRT